MICKVHMMVSMIDDGMGILQIDTTQITDLKPKEKGRPEIKRKMEMETKRERKIKTKTHTHIEPLLPLHPMALNSYKSTWKIET